MATYQKADAATVKLLEEVRVAHHDVRLLDVTISVLMAYAPIDDDGEPTGYAITHHGVRALGKARIVPLRDRVHGMADAEILLDGDEWKTTSTRMKRALIDHELTHFDRTGEVDDAGRPKLKIRPHDFEVGWFHEVAHRHGDESIEIQQAQQLVADHGPLYFDFVQLPTKKRSAA